MAEVQELGWLSLRQIITPLLKMKNEVTFATEDEATWGDMQTAVVLRSCGRHSHELNEPDLKVLLKNIFNVYDKI